MDNEKKVVIRFILLMGMVSLFADMVYETARGVMGPYLGFLGANAFAIGLIFGVGEFLGYFLRIVAGVIVDKTKKYWSFVFIGYGAIISIPLLAFANYWLLAGTLILLERIGKALRAPAKDTILSLYSKNIGKGLTFGIHETADQIGAVVGPILFYIFLAIGLGYKTSFLILAVPFVFVILSLILSRLYVGRISVDVSKETHVSNGNNKLDVYVYLVFVFLTSLGFVSFPIISYHAVNVKLLNDTFVPLIYSLVMILDAMVAIPIGILYDRIGVKIMAVLPILITISVGFGLSNSLVLLVIGLILWGVIMSAYETIVRAYIGDNVSLGDRGKFYGIFNTVLGISFAIGNSVVGYLYDISISLIIYLVVLVEIFALLLVLIVSIIKSRSSNNKV